MGEKWLDWDAIESDGLPACSYCRNLRRVRLDVQREHEDFGKLKPCPACGSLAVRQRLQERYYAKLERIEQYTLLRGEAKRQTFDSFDPRIDEGRPALPVRIAKNKAKAFAQEPKAFFILHGSRGTGKSHLAAAIANHVRRKKEPRRLVLFFVVPELLEMLRSGYDEGDYQELLDLCKSVDLLILDDLGAESGTSWAHEKLFQIINRRYIDGSPTVVATNCELRELEPRIYSRLADDRNIVVGVTAPDYRQRKRNPGEVI
jgi:DNA replication protein DnaC